MGRLKALAASLALLVAGAAFAQSATAPDAIYFNGNVLTVDAEFSTVQAFAVQGERFTATGTDAEIRKLAGPATLLIDLRGATVIPGMSDNHDHMWNSGKYLHRGVDLIGVTTWSEMERRLRAAVARARPGEVVFTTTGWTLPELPSRAQLDAISDQVPIVAIRFRRGAAVYNGAALRKLGVSKSSPSFHGASVPVDSQGEPTGLPPHYPENVLMIDALIPALTPAEQDSMVRAESKRRHALGITSIRELAVWPEAVQALERMRREGKLTLRIGLGVEFPDVEATTSHLAASSERFRDDQMLFVDSTGEEPWTPGVLPLDSFTRFSSEVARLGWRPAPHVNSDGALGTSADAATEGTLAAYEAVDRQAPLAGKRWYVEHVPFATPEQMKRMAKLGLVVSAQSYGYYANPSAALPAERLAHYNPIRGFLDHGLIVIGGSDTPGPTAVEMAPNNPLIPFYYYVTRKARSGEVRTPQERINRPEALRIFTANPAIATFQERQRGSIAPGLLADFVILDQDLMTVPEDRILATRTLATFVGGRRVYAAHNSPY